MEQDSPMTEQPSLSSFKAMSFDCYGTIIDWESGILSVLRPWIKASGLSLGDEEILAAYAEAEPFVERAQPRALYPDILRTVVRRLADKFSIKANAVVSEGLANSVGNWPPFADSSNALTRLGKRYKLIILSNIDRASIGGSQELLAVNFDAVYTAEDIGSYKPDRRNFEYLLSHAKADLDLAPQEILHVAQSLYHDHVPAKAKGLSSCWIDRRKGREGSGATPTPIAPITTDFRFPTLAALAEAAGV